MGGTQREPVTPILNGNLVSDTDCRRHSIERTLDLRSRRQRCDPQVRGGPANRPWNTWTIGAGRGELIRILSGRLGCKSLRLRLPRGTLRGERCPPFPQSTLMPLPFRIPTTISTWVTSSEVVEHLENYRHLLREAFRVLKPGSPVVGHDSECIEHEFPRSLSSDRICKPFRSASRSKRKALFHRRTHNAHPLLLPGPRPHGRRVHRSRTGRRQGPEDLPFLARPAVPVRMPRLAEFPEEGKGRSTKPSRPKTNRTYRNTSSWRGASRPDRRGIGREAAGIGKSYILTCRRTIGDRLTPVRPSPPVHSVRRAGIDSSGVLPGTSKIFSRNLRQGPFQAVAASLFIPKTQDRIRRNQDRQPQQKRRYGLHGFFVIETCP